jgi:hypothetical protein
MARHERKTRSKGIRIAAGLLGFAMVAAGCTDGSAESSDPGRSTVAPTSTIEVGPQPGSTTEVPASPAANDLFDRTAKAVGTTLACVALDKDVHGLRVGDNSFDNYEHQVGKDGDLGTADDPFLPVSIHLLRTETLYQNERKPTLRFESTLTGTDGSFRTLVGSLIVGNDDPALKSPRFEPGLAGEAMQHASTTGLAARHAQASGPVAEFGTAIRREESGSLTYWDSSAIRPATGQDVASWSLDAQATLVAIARNANAPQCVPESIPSDIQPVPEGQLPVEQMV